MGNICFPAPCPDYATIKYNASGQQQWVARYNGPGNGDDVASAIAIDGSGNVYVTGGSTGSAGDDDYATIKYNGSGAQQWVARYSAPGSSTDYAYTIAVDGSGNVYVTGQSGSTEALTDYATVKYNASGTQQWVARYNGPANDSDIAVAIAVDSSVTSPTGSAKAQGVITTMLLSNTAHRAHNSGLIATMARGMAMTLSSLRLPLPLTVQVVHRVRAASFSSRRLTRRSMLLLLAGMPPDKNKDSVRFSTRRGLSNRKGSARSASPRVVRSTKKIGDRQIFQRIYEKRLRQQLTRIGHPESLPSFTFRASLYIDVIRAQHLFAVNIRKTIVSKLR